jgi:cytochrome c2
MAGLNHKHYRFWIAVAVVATAILVVLLMRQSRSGERRALYIVGVPEKGAELFYGDKQCSTCHAVNGSGGRVAPDLSGKRPSTPAMGWLTAVLWNHAPGMWRQMRHGNVSYPHLNSEEMAHILAFLYEAGNVDPPGDPNAGQRVFDEKGCVQCHSVRSSGGKTAPELSTVAGSGGSSAWTRAMWNHAQAMVDPVTRALGHWPQFTGSEMNDLIAYVGAGASNARERVHPVRGSAERGWQVFQTKCIQCHSVRGQGGAVGPELGPQTELPLSTSQFAGVLWNHAPTMLKVVRGLGIPALLEGDQIVDLQMFLASLRYFEPTGSAFVGERVFTERGCAGCHGSAAEGTQQAPPLRSGPEAFTTVSFTTALWKHGPKMVDRAEESGTRWPMLQATDIGDLVSFLNERTRHK